MAVVHGSKRSARSAVLGAACLAAWAGTRMDAGEEETAAARSGAQPVAAGDDAPEGMVWIPGGEFAMGGVGPDARADELPVHRVRVEGFWIDVTEVTVAQFERFVEATGYVTTAERALDWSEVEKSLPPGTPKPDDALLAPGALVFVPPRERVGLDDWRNWWKFVPGASWRKPLGVAPSDPRAAEHPVVQVSWHDAVAYATWADKRLPTEAEWEYACRGGLEGRRFAWGDDPPGESPRRANLWQGEFPIEDSGADGFAGIAPVKSFPPNGYGLHDMIGNAWEWCADWYRADAYAADAKLDVAVDPRGPDAGEDAAEPGVEKRVTRGGSFLCDAVYCASYRPSARMRAPPDSPQSHVGFRCVRSKTRRP